MTSLILEGGTFRTVFTVGVLDALLDNNILFPYVIGVSAGISYGASYVSRQRGRNLEIIEKYRNDSRYEGVLNLRNDRSLFGIQFVYETIPNELIPFDYTTYRDFKGTMLVTLTNATTGKAEYFDGLKVTTKNELFVATCSLPLIFPGTKINDELYYDGGIADSIPIAKAIKDGNQKHLIVLTQPKGYQKTLDTKTKAAIMHVKHRYPNLARAMYNRHVRYNKQLEVCHLLEKRGQAVILQPTNPLRSSEKDIEVLKQTYKEGYEQTVAKLDKIKELLM